MKLTNIFLMKKQKQKHKETTQKPIVQTQKTIITPGAIEIPPTF